MQAEHDILQSVLSKTSKNTAWQTPIHGLTIYSTNQHGQVSGILQKPSLSVMLQGEQSVTLGEKVYYFKARQMLFCPVNLPIIAQIHNPNREWHLVMSLDFDLDLLTNISTRIPKKPHKNQSIQWTLTDRMYDCVLRLLNLLDFPDDISVVAPLIIQEWYYYLWISEQGAYLQELVGQDGKFAKIRHATQILEQNFLGHINMIELSEKVGMSKSVFYSEFKAVTELTPLQYQKSLRLNYAKNLILKENLSVSEVAFAVGYESVSQFSREFKRAFGVSPSHK